MKRIITICDRCKGECNPYTLLKSVLVPRMYGFGEIDFDSDNGSVCAADLCDECYGELMKWWEREND